METLIKFRLLAEELNESEAPIFLSKLFETSNVYELIISSIFTHFASKIIKSKPFDSDEINNINNIIYQIVHSRKNNSKAIIDMDLDTETNLFDEEITITLTAISLDHIPPELISNISSFCSFRDFISLQLSNRKTYIGCNSPCSLHEYLSPCFRDPLAININKCSSIKHISIDISSNTQRDQKNNKQVMLDIVSNNTCPYFDNIKRLSIGSFGPADGKLLDELTQKLPNLEYLDLVDVYDTYTNHSGWHHKPVPKLKGLSLHFSKNFRAHYGVSAGICRKLFDAYSSKIISLCCNDSVRFPVWIFPALRNLKIESNGGNAVKNIINNNTLLENVCLDMCEPRTHPSFQLQQSLEIWMKAMILNIFKTQTQLKYFEAHMKISKMQQLFDAIALGLQVSRIRRRNMKIQTILNDNSKKGLLKWNKFIAAMNKVISKLNNDDINDWVFSCTLISKHHEMSLEDEQIQTLDALNETYLVQYFIEKKTLKVVVSNKGNPMYGGYCSYDIYIQ